MQQHPILRDIKNIGIYVLIWFFVIGMNFSLLYFGLETSFSIAIVDSLVFNSILCLAGLSFWFPVKYISIDNNNISAILFTHLVGSLITTAFWLVAGFYLISFLLDFSFAFSTFFWQTLVWRIFIGLLFYFLIVSFYYVITYYGSLQEKIIQESELKNLVTEAELKSLKFQVNPHFIFNSLNSISALTSIDPVKARDMIIKLADFLRYTLSNNTRQQNYLSEELKNVKLYLEIEKIRFEDRFEYIEEVNPDCANTLIPNMLLQPLLENAIKHAVYEAIDKVVIRLNCFKDNGYLKIFIQNNFEPGLSGRKGSGIGLKNIGERLELVYARKGLIQVKKDEGMFKVMIYIPV